VEDSKGKVAAYGLFWWDPDTGVGLVEPMRTEQPYWRMGLARHLLTNGLDRLATLGASRLKVSYLSDNPAARELYASCGFRPDSTSRTFRRQS
jgi:RimJ/RimL family protein N-acetyltransferase